MYIPNFQSFLTSVEGPRSRPVQCGRVPPEGSHRSVGVRETGTVHPKPTLRVEVPHLDILFNLYGFFK